MKIFTVIGNAPKHNKDGFATLLDNRQCVFYAKPDSALLRNGKPFFLPDELGKVACRVALAVRICRLGKNIPRRFAHRYYDAFTVGVNFTAVEELQRLRAEGLPWEGAVAFDGSAVVGEWIAGDELTQMPEMPLRLEINGEEQQQPAPGDWQQAADGAIAHISRYITLRTGDILFLETTPAARPVAINDHIEGFLNDREVLHFNVK